MKTLEAHADHDMTRRTGEGEMLHRTRHMLREVADGICTLTFDRPKSSANVLSRDVLLELNTHLDWLEHLSDLRGLILTSAKENIFVAGADVHELAGLAEPRAPDRHGPHSATRTAPARPREPRWM